MVAQSASHARELLSNASRGSGLGGPGTLAERLRNAYFDGPIQLQGASVPWSDLTDELRDLMVYFEGDPKAQRLLLEGLSVEESAGRGPRSVWMSCSCASPAGSISPDHRRYRLATTAHRRPLRGFEDHRSNGRPKEADPPPGAQGDSPRSRIDWRRIRNQGKGRSPRKRPAKMTSGTPHHRRTDRPRSD